MMTVAESVRKMIAYYEGNRHDIAHFLKVWAYARTIGELEELEPDMQETVELAAVVHDIACPLCRKKYGNASGANQERESEALVRDFLRGAELPAEKIDRIAFLVAHHHSPAGVDGADYQILLEADYLVNADEGGCSRENILNTLERMFKTEAGVSLLRAAYL